VNVLPFSVLTDAWIPVDTGEELSLLDTLARSHALKAISAASPLETYATYRLLIAFLMDALQMPHRDARLEVLARGKFDMAAIQAYVACCEADGVSFDLFDKARPFMQAAYDPQYDHETKPVSELVQALPTGNNHMFFDHRYARDHELGCAQAFRAMIATYVFCAASVQDYPSSVNNTPCAYILVEGKTLFETLVLNCMSVRECNISNIAYGLTAWREPNPVIPKREQPDVDMLEGLTWRPRRVTLVPEDSVIRTVYLQQGLNYKGNGSWRDPHVAYIKTNKDLLTTLKLDTARAVWRDIGKLAASSEGKRGYPPRVISNLPSDWGLVRATIAGLVTDQASFVDMIWDRLVIPQSILDNEERGDRLQTDIAFIETCAKQLKNAVLLLGEEGKGQKGKLTSAQSKMLDRKDGDVAANVVQTDFFQVSHGFVFGDYLARLAACATDEDYIALILYTDQEIGKQLTAVLGRYFAQTGYDAKSLIAQAKIRKRVMMTFGRYRKERENGITGNGDDTAGA
jgi:CRISPR type I-E-associated protein CasA/Cse1